jgi:GxxExxY protein
MNTAARFVLRLACMTHPLADLYSLTQKIIGCAIEVHRVLGPGLLESAYRDALSIELRLHELRVEIDRPVHLDYKGQRLTGTLRLDLVVEETVVVELKAVESLLPVHSAQVITYLKVAGYPAGLLMNFNSTTLCAGMKRLDHPDVYIKKP